MYIANCPFNKMKILSKATIGLEKSFQMMYSNIGLNSRETVPLSVCTWGPSDVHFLEVLTLEYADGQLARGGHIPQREAYISQVLHTEKQKLDL